MPWYKRAYRRNVIDMHITEHDERFLSEFDARQYVDMLLLAKVQSAVVYAHSHVGHCYYPSRIGHMHSGLNGRNIFGEVADLCHKNSIAVVAYYSVIFDRWAYENHRDWRIIRMDGTEANTSTAPWSRHGVCCPNSPYREYAAAHAEEIVNNFDVDGIRFDMTFWPSICFCIHCRKRFQEEVGGEIPLTIDWQDPRWVSFERKREEWITDFASLLTSTIRRSRPGVTVEHQSSTLPLSWDWGVTWKLAAQNDFLQGDFYGDRLHSSFSRKLFYNLSPNQPYGFETSITADLAGHTSLKSEDLLRAKVYASLADGGAFVFIDAIDPAGTLNRAVYERMGRVFEESSAYEQYLGGELCQDVGVFLSTESKCDPAYNGKRLEDRAKPPNPMYLGTPHVDAAVSACKTLIDNHIPYGVITKKNLGELSRHRVVVLPKVLMMDDEEVDAFRDYVRSGGSIYVSGPTSLLTKAGVRRSDFMLTDVCGVSCVGETTESFTYVAPTEASDGLLGDCSVKYPLGFPSKQMLVKAHPSAKVLGTLVLPYFDPSDGAHYSSIHSNPPGVATGQPAIVMNRFGNGKSIYVATDLESHDLHRAVFRSLVRHLGGPFTLEADAPKSVEISLWRQEVGRRYLINFVNFQAELPNIPVDGIRVTLRLGDARPQRLMLLPEETDLRFESRDGQITFDVPRLETFRMLALDCR